MRGSDKSEQRNRNSEKQKMGKTGTQLNNLSKTTATVIPAPRKSVKRMMFESFVTFIANLCSSEAISPERVIGDDGNA